MGAPFAAMLRRHESDYNDSNDCVLKIVVVFLSTSSNVVQVKFSSIALQVKSVTLHLIVYVKLFFFLKPLYMCFFFPCLSFRLLL